MDNNFEIMNWTDVITIDHSNEVRWVNPVPLIVGCCLSAVTVLANLLLAAALIVGQNFNTFIVCIFHLVALDIATGACVFPLSISSYYLNEWTHGDVVCSFWVTLDTFIPSLILVTCCVINFERLLELFSSKYRLWRGEWSWKQFVLIWIPWGLTVAIGVPIFFVGTEQHDMMRQMCYFTWRNSYFLTFNSLMYFLPVVVMTVTVTVANVCSFRKGMADLRDNVKSSAVAILSINVSVLLMFLPFTLLVFITTVSVFDINHSVVWMLHYTQLSNSAVRPFLWLFETEVRSGYVALFRKCCRRSHETVAFRDTSRSKPIP